MRHVRALAGAAVAAVAVTPAVASRVAPMTAAAAVRVRKRIAAPAEVE